MVKEFFQKSFVIFTTMAICVILLETGLRILGKNPSNMTEGIYEDNGKDSYRLQKNISKRNNWSAFSYTVYTNSFGFRDKEIRDVDLSNKDFIMFIGDSQTFASGVDYEKTFIGVIADHLAQKNIEVLNCGIGGHYFIEQVELFKNFIETQDKTPSKVFIGFNPLLMYTFDEIHNSIVVKSGYLFSKASWVLPYIRILVSNISSAYCFFRDNIRTIQVKTGNIKNELPPFLRVYHRKSKLTKEEKIKQFYSYLTSFNAYCSKRNITPVYLYLPIIDDYNLENLLIGNNRDPKEFDAQIYVRLLISYCNEYNVQFINLNPVLKKYYEDGVELRFKLDPHYNEFTNRLVGEYILSKFYE